MTTVALFNDVPPLVAERIRLLLSIPPVVTDAYVPAEVTPRGLPPTVARNTPPAVIADATSAAEAFALRITEIVLLAVSYVALVALSADVIVRLVLLNRVPPAMEVKRIE
jgi:hypothetical protein